LKPFILPEASVDGFEVIWYKVDPDWTDRKYYIITKMRAVYHANTPWSDFSPNSKGGADLEDCWMIYSDENNYPDGRTLEWNGISHYSWTNSFASIEEAKLKAIGYCTDRLGELYKKIAEVNDTLAYLHEGE
jgi:hypothetical protein